MNKILITGGSGLFSVNFALRQNKNYEIFLIQNKKKINLTNKHNNIKLVKVDINNKNNIKTILNDIKPDYVIHAAAITNVDFCEKNMKIAKKTNFNLTKNIVDQCKKINCSLIFLSSDQLFNGKKNFYNEFSKPSPLNYYSKLKVESESYIKKKLKNFLIIRTNFFGWGTSYRKSFSDNVIFNIKDKKKIYILKDVYFNPISLKYLCKAISKLIELKKYGTYNITTNKKISKYELAKKISNVFKLDENFLKPVLLKKLKSNVLRPHNMYLKNSKLTKFFKVPSINIQIIDLLKEYKNKYYINFKDIKNNEK